MILKELEKSVEGWRRILCSCDCGCGETFIKKPKDMGVTQFINKRHYKSYLKNGCQQITNKILIECDCGCGKKMWRYKSNISRYNFYNTNHRAKWMCGRNRWGVIEKLKREKFSLTFIRR